MQKSSSTPPLTDKLVDLKTGYGAVGVSVAQGLRREANPERYPDWLVRYVVGVGKDGRQLTALRLSEINRYIESRPKVAKPQTKNPVLVARGSKGGTKAKAKRDAAKAVPSEPAARAGKARQRTSSEVTA